MDMDKVRVGVIAIGAILAAIVDSIPFTVWVLVALMTLNAVSGLLSAFINDGMSSVEGRKWLARKAQILVLVAATVWVQTNAVGVPLTEIVAGSFAMRELLSILENAAKVGIQIPEPLRNALLRVGPPK
jgi:toxin secretion/phage lysis holin